MLVEGLSAATLGVVVGLFFYFRRLIGQKMEINAEIDPEQISEVVGETFIGIMSDEENIKNVSEFIQANITATLTETLPQLENQMTENIKASPEYTAAKEQLGEMAGDMIDHAIPLPVQLYLDNRDKDKPEEEKWREDFKTNPQKYQIMLQLAQKSGILGWLGDMTGQLGIGTDPQSPSTPSTTPTNKNKGGYY